MTMTLAVDDRIRIRASVNEWISKKFPSHRKYISHAQPEYSETEEVWSVALETRNVNGHSVPLAKLLVSEGGRISLRQRLSTVVNKLDLLLLDDRACIYSDRLFGDGYDFVFGDGIEAASRLGDGYIDLLLTDPPYGISKAYTCESQVPRRLRKDGRDFIMPRGNFGEWDQAIEPGVWLEVVLPKVSGWFVTFCAQAQIGIYTEILRDNRFVAVGTLVWQKTNPVPFNHKYKPINAWEAVVIGKRPGTKFNGRVVHNVFVHKSPSPQHRIHPTQKPLALIRTFVKLFSDKEDFVFDPFAGAATTLIAASKLRRKVVSYESDQSIYEAACERISEHIQ